MSESADSALRVEHTREVEEAPTEQRSGRETGEKQQSDGD